jgi:multidrug efflux pump subunit AcrA (membrane-fusion protein)
VTSEHAWKTWLDLFDELRRIEVQAGVSPGIATLYGSPEPSRDEYDLRRRRLRRAYFEVRDTALRTRMIGYAAELQRRERAETSLQQLSAQRAVAQAKDGGNWFVFALAVLVPLACVWIGYLLAGVPGEIGGVVVAMLVAGALFRRERRKIDRAIKAAEGRLAVADNRARALEERAPVFEEREAQTGVESLEFGTFGADTDQKRSAASGGGARLWLATRTYSAL